MNTPRPFDVETIRRDFPILATRVHTSERDSAGVPLVYLDNGATTQRPRQVIDSLVEVYERHYANVHRGIHWLSEKSTDLYSQTREKVRRFINAAESEEIIFVDGTTEAINLVARSWGDANVRAGDEIVLTELEHHANLVPWQQLAQRHGCRLRHIPITPQGTLDLDALPALLGPRTRLVAFAAVSNVLGTINPVAQIVKAAHDVGALALVDAAQSAPHEPTDVQAWNADFVAFSGHKMLGPSGIGVLYGRRSVLEAMPPFMGGGGMIRRVALDSFEPADLPDRFEAGTPPIVPAIGLGAAIDYLEALGLDAIRDHERQLTERAHERLSEVPGLHILGPEPAAKGGIVSFTIDGVHPHDVAHLLDRQGIAVRAGHHCAMPLHKRLGIVASTRASFYLYNTLAEIDALAAGLQSVRRVLRRPVS